MALFKPRFVARVFVPNVGDPQTRTQQEQLDDVTQLQVRCHRLRLVSNSHNDADECEIHGSYDEMGIDPRFLKSAEIYLHAGMAADDGTFTPTQDNLRFIGIVTYAERAFSESGKGVHLRALDYTSLFLNAKQFPPDGIPEFSDTIESAWDRVCDNTGYYDLASNRIVSTVTRLRDRIQLVGLDAPGPTLGTAVGPRLAKLGKLQVPANPCAWDVWQTAVGSLGLISFIRNDRCIVTTATDYYTGEDPPRFTYGKNVLTLTETRDLHALSGKNVGILAWDPLTHTTVEAFWPPLSLATQQKKLGGSALGTGVAVRAQDYEIFDCPFGITDPAVLERFAERVWEERSRQELSGELVTRKMEVSTLSGQIFDAMALQAGDRIRVEIERDALTQIQRLPTESQRIRAMRERGYSESMARYVVTNLDAITKLTPEFQVHSVETEIDTTEPPGTYNMRIHYRNRIDVSGSAQPGTGTDAPPPVTGQVTYTSPKPKRSR